MMNKIESFFIRMGSGFLQTALIGVIVLGIIYIPFPYNYIGLALILWAGCSFDSPYEIKIREIEEILNNKINDLNNVNEFLKERVDVLEEMNEAKRIFMSSHGAYLGKDHKWMNYKEARIWAEENNYKYVKPFERLGELWVKREEK